MPLVTVQQIERAARLDPGTLDNPDYDFDSHIEIVEDYVFSRLMDIYLKDSLLKSKTIINLVKDGCVTKANTLIYPGKDKESESWKSSVDSHINKIRKGDAELLDSAGNIIHRISDQTSGGDPVRVSYYNSDGPIFTKDTMDGW